MKKILDVGQCSYDGPRMTEMLKCKVGVSVDKANSLDEAAQKLGASKYDLVMVNRELAFEDAEGIDLIKSMKQSGDNTPVMLVSDKPDAQLEAESLGAVHGFGKSQMNTPETIELIRKTIGLAE